MFQKPEEKKINPKDKITPMDILLFVILVITIVMAFLALTLQPNYYAHDEYDTTTTTTAASADQSASPVTESTSRGINVYRLISAIFCSLAFLCIVSSTVLHTILFCTCEKNARNMNISVIVLVWFGFLFFAVAAGISYRQVPNDGAWLMSAACVTVVSTLIAVFLLLEEQHIDRNEIH
ncbi:hypothetical protein FBUS_02895 [Fasciolopsis buskii]|uniref:Uncharacterized protein n=1 Tax=Fasciolopsis buskii TaxID=27845 RepID=A0A8E0RY87_9TREM|nr:hypothetical protein FBUS_02895 [Fasciolopsis buski]